MQLTKKATFRYAQGSGPMDIESTQAWMFPEGITN
jgi:hypothetical protein